MTFGIGLPFTPNANSPSARSGILTCPFWNLRQHLVEDAERVQEVLEDLEPIDLDHEFRFLDYRASHGTSSRGSILLPTVLLCHDTR